MKYDKLVRDKIPEIIRDNGDKPIIHQAGDKEYEDKLKQKLEEEVKEFLDSEAKEELADILEVIRALSQAKGLDFESIEKIREEKAGERGSFADKIILEETK